MLWVFRITGWGEAGIGWREGGGGHEWNARGAINHSTVHHVTRASYYKQLTCQSRHLSLPCSLYRLRLSGSMVQLLAHRAQSRQLLSVIESTGNWVAFNRCRDMTAKIHSLYCLNTCYSHVHIIQTFTATKAEDISLVQRQWSMRECM